MNRSEQARERRRRSLSPPQKFPRSGILTRSRARAENEDVSVACGGEASCSSADSLCGKRRREDSADIAGPPAKRAATGKRSTRLDYEAFENTGMFSHLPREIIREILTHCKPKQLAQMASTCQWFREDGEIDEVAREKLREIPRAKDVVPREGETWVQLLAFFSAQSAAAAQSTSLNLGAHHTAGLLVESDPASHDPRWGPVTLRTWGRNFYGQLGAVDFQDRPTPAPVRLGSTLVGEPDPLAAVVACGSSHSMCITRRGELFTWGLASSGELGHFGALPIEVPVPRQVLSLCNLRIVAISAGASHSMAIGEDGSVWTCGKGRHGQLGHGNFHDEGVLTCVEALRNIRIVSMAAGAAHSVALASDGTLYTWGDGRCGQLGHPALAVSSTIALSKPWKVQALDPRVLRPEDRVTAVAAGGHHTLAITVAGQLMVFGKNTHGQLGTFPRGGPGRGSVWHPTPARVGVRDQDRGACVRVVQAAGGLNHTLVLLHRNGVPVVRSAGANHYGQLGRGSNKNAKNARLFQTVRRLEGKNVVAIMSGEHHCAAAGPDGEVYVWGRGDSGQLGLGDDRNRWAPVRLRGMHVVHPDRTLRRKGGNVVRLEKSPEELASEAASRPESKSAALMRAWLQGYQAGFS